MNFPWAQIDEPGHGISPPERTPLIRYGIGAIILVSLAVACLHFIPLIHRDLRLLHDVYTLDVKGMALEGDLQYEIQESRRRFLRILLAAHNPQEMQQEIRLMQRYDATVAVTVVQLSQLGVIPELQESQFRASWNRYQTVRDRMVDKIQSGHGSEVRAIDYDLGNGIFDPVEQAVHASQASFEATAASHLAEVSGTLKREVVEVLVVVVAKICALILLIWIDWRRARAESQLRKATRSLKASEDRFQLAYESATVGMGIFKLDGTIVSCNRMAAQMLGYEVNELIGTKIVNFIGSRGPSQHHSLTSRQLGQKLPCRAQGPPKRRPLRLGEQQRHPAPVG
jgi:PAS domain-containing protein